MTKTNDALLQNNKKAPNGKTNNRKLTHSTGFYFDTWLNMLRN